ncbi:transposase [Bradyrhizobium centrosematis]|nr:transposase [Bradyrhizobium centrosematis]MCS3758582.1 transposase [Bradyrhizobium centrosematis]MCS3773530.1 transposase [Bradyrhizobium centrosematis]
MIDTAIVRVHQHAACITKNQRQSIGRSRGGLASKIHALVDSNGLPVRLTLSPGEAHDVRLAGKLLSRSKSASMLLADRGYDADWIRELAMEKRRMGEHPAEEQSQRSNLLEPLSLPRPQQGGTVPQQDQTMSSRRDTLRQACSQLPQLASIRLGLRVNESAS